MGRKKGRDYMFLDPMTVTLEIGNQTIWMGMVHMFLCLVKSMKEKSKRESKKVMENVSIQMVEFMKDRGRKILK